MDAKSASTGKVIIAGAGPGDPELCTLRTLRWLAQADVVITDRLVSEELLTGYVSPQAQILHVGKQSGKKESVGQLLINELLVDYALQGLLVVRLKGGDPSVYGHLTEELQALQAHQIPYEIVPGVTAASGVAARCGIPLTARGYSNGVRLLTYHDKGISGEPDWNELARSRDTLVFYMSSAKAGVIVRKLTAAGIGYDTHIAVVEQATTPCQQVYESNIYAYLNQHGTRDFASPTLIIVGRVVALYRQFAWIQRSAETKEYFTSPGPKKPAEERA